MDLKVTRSGSDRAPVIVLALECAFLGGWCRVCGDGDRVGTAARGERGGVGRAEEVQLGGGEAARHVSVRLGRAAR